MSEGVLRDLMRKVDRNTRAVERQEAVERVTTGTPGDIAALDTRIDALETYQMPTSDANVSSPPTDAELDAAFGTPAAVGDGYIAFVDDAGTGAQVWLVTSDGTNWWYEALTKAV
jgi:hypothetical protein